MTLTLRVDRVQVDVINWCWSWAPFKPRLPSSSPESTYIHKSWLVLLHLMTPPLATSQTVRSQKAEEGGRREKEAAVLITPTAHSSSWQTKGDLSLAGKWREGLANRVHNILQAFLFSCLVSLFSACLAQPCRVKCPRWHDTKNQSSFCHPSSLSSKNISEKKRGRLKKNFAYVIHLCVKACWYLLSSKGTWQWQVCWCGYTREKLQSLFGKKERQNKRANLVVSWLFFRTSRTKFIF